MSARGSADAQAVSVTARCSEHEADARASIRSPRLHVCVTHSRPRPASLDVVTGLSTRPDARGRHRLRLCPRASPGRQPEDVLPGPWLRQGPVKTARLGFVRSFILVSQLFQFSCRSFVRLSLLCSVSVTHALCPYPCLSPCAPRPSCSSSASSPRPPACSRPRRTSTSPRAPRLRSPRTATRARRANVPVTRVPRLTTTRPRRPSRPAPVGVSVARCVTPSRASTSIARSTSPP